MKIELRPVFCRRPLIGVSRPLSASTAARLSAAAFAAVIMGNLPRTTAKPAARCAHQSTASSGMLIGTAGHIMVVMPLTKVTFIFVIACAICGCSSRQPNQTAASMKSSLASDIPVGTPVATAEAKLQALGFSVSRQVNARWASTTQPSDYLYGDKRESGVVQRRWQVAVFHQQGVVTGIDVQTGLVGP